MTAIATRVDPDTEQPATARPTTPETGRRRPTDAPTTTPTEGILATLRTALQALADVDPDALDSRAPVGRATLPLAGTARSAVAALGGDPGMALTHAPGIVVGRDLVAATTLLDTTARSHRATTSTTRTTQRLAQLALDADRRLTELLAQVHEVVTRHA